MHKKNSLSRAYSYLEELFFILESQVINVEGEPPFRSHHGNNTGKNHLRMPAPFGERFLGTGYLHSQIS